MTGWRLAPANVCWCLIGIVLVWGLVVPPKAVGDALGWRRFQAPLAPEWTVAQRFRMNLNGLTALQIRASEVGPVRGRYVLRLSDRSAPEVTRIGEVSAADLVRAESYYFRFAPIAESAGHEFMFEVAPAPGDPGRGVALWATKGERLDEGELRINGQPRWASLAFQTYTPAVSSFWALTHADDPDRPPAWFALVGLLGSWISLRFVLKALSNPDVPGIGSGVSGPPVSGSSLAGDSTAERATAPTGAQAMPHDAPGAPPAVVR